MKVLSYKDKFNPVLMLFQDVDGMKPVELPLPEPPKWNSDIDGHDRGIAGQYFRRTEMPARFNSLPKKFKKEFIDQEWERRAKGYWFYNKGQITHMTGTHYLYCNWWYTKFGFPNFRMNDLEKFHYWKHVVNTDWSYGMIEMQSRQVAKSSIAGVIVFDAISRTFNVLGGIQSKTDDDAGTLFMDKIIYPMRKLPYFFIPKYDTASGLKNEIKFSKVMKRGEKFQDNFIDMDTLQRQIDKGNIENLEVGSWIDFRSSEDTAYDGATRLYRWVNDEAGKLSEGLSTLKRWSIVKPALFNKGLNKVFGKALHTTTVEYMDKSGGRNWKELWDNSSPERNTTGLMQYFCPHYKCKDYDRFGFADEQANRESWDREFNRLGVEEKGFYRRQNPRSVADCFAVPGKDDFFGYQIMERVIDEYKYKKVPVNGNFKWTRTDENVYFEPIPSGRWKQSFLFPTPDQSNKQFYLNGMRCPDNVKFGVAGADIFGKSLGTQKKTRWHSDGSVLVFRKRNFGIDDPKITPWEEIIEGDKRYLKINHVTERFCCTYRYRPPTKEEFYEDVLMTCVYYGVQLYPEMNMGEIDKYFIERGYGGYLYYDVNRKTRKYEMEAGDRTTEQVKQQIFLEWKSHIHKNGMREVHPEIYEELIQIDEDLNKYDMAVAGGYALMANSKQSGVQEIIKLESGGQQFIEEYEF